jgi:hypothetical protein
MPRLLALYIITHSRWLVRPLLYHSPTHWRLGDDVSLQDWCNRAVVPTDLDELVKVSRERWHGVQKMIGVI